MKDNIKKREHLKKDPWCYLCLQDGVWNKAKNVIQDPPNEDGKVDIFRLKSVCQWHYDIIARRRKRERSIKQSTDDNTTI